MSAGAYRGYGATQGIFAVESMVNRLADKLGMDPLEIRYKNMTHEGDVMLTITERPQIACLKTV